MNLFRNIILRKIAATALLVAFISGLASRVSSQGSTSVLGLWLADRLADNSGLTREQVLEQAGQFSDKASFFKWAAVFVQNHASDFEFPVSGDRSNENVLEHSLREAWDNRFADEGMSGSTARIELPKNWHFEAKQSSTLQRAVAVSGCIRDYQLSEPAVTVVSLLAEPHVSGIAIGAP